jgi:hypothetical protein
VAVEIGRQSGEKINKCVYRFALKSLNSTRGCGVCKMIHRMIIPILAESSGCEKVLKVSKGGNRLLAVV